MSDGRIDRRQVLGMMTGVAAMPLLPLRASAREVARLGDRSVISVSDGSFELPLSMLARGRNTDELQALLKEEGLPIDVSRSVLNVTLLKDGDSYTIFDCGAGANFLPGSGQLAKSLEAAGISPDAVKQVLFTHAHPDHLWGAIDEFDSDLFPNASYAISEVEWAFWTSPDVFSKLPEDRHSFAAGAQRVLKAIAEKTSRFKPGKEVAPGVLALDTPGHTPGHVSYQIGGGGKSLVVLGDAITHKAISFRHPEWKSGSDTDVDQGITTRKRLLDQLATDRTPFIGYHLPVPGLGHAERMGPAYRLVS